MGESRDRPFVPRLGPWTLDRAPVRQRLQSSLASVVGKLDLAVTIDVGSGAQPWRSCVTDRGGGYVAVDIDVYAGVPSPNVRWDGNRLPIRDHAATTVLLTEVAEHVPDTDRMFREIERVLTPGGSLYLTVPFLWPIHDAPFDEYRFTPFALRRLLHAAGFEVKSMWALGGWDASLAQLLGLWARRRPMSRLGRRVTSVAVFPIVWILLRRDATPALDRDGMITGLACLATPKS